MAAWVANLARPRSSSLLDQGVWALTLAYLAAVAAAALLLWGAGDVWWPATVLLFGPRWVLLLPLALLVPAVLARDRPLLLPLSLAALVTLGPVMDVRTGWRGLFVQPDPARDVTVATLNAGGGELTRSLGALMTDWGADIALLQECGGPLREDVRRLGRIDGEFEGDVRAASLCVVSRYPIVDVTEMEREELRLAGGSGLVATFSIELDDGTVDVTTIHLETPREGFELLRSGRLARGVERIGEKSALREIELRRARRWVDRSSRPRIVAGDFNTPPESRAYRDAWADWTNTFSQVGVGFGGTRLNGWIRPRIDHVLVDERWTVVDARLGENVGSDHLPVVATIRLER